MNKSSTNMTLLKFLGWIEIPKNSTYHHEIKMAMMLDPHRNLKVPPDIEKDFNALHDVEVLLSKVDNVLYNVYCKKLTYLKKPILKITVKDRAKILAELLKG